MSWPLQYIYNQSFLQALLKKVKTLRLSQLIQANSEAKIFLKKIMALACLPADMIQREYEALVHELEAPLRRQLEPFLAYYQRQWLRIVKPAGFSVFGLSKRTNNVIESYNSVLSRELGRRPSAWTFICKSICYNLWTLFFLRNQSKILHNARSNFLPFRRILLCDKLVKELRLCHSVWCSGYSSIWFFINNLILLFLATCVMFCYFLIL